MKLKMANNIITGGSMVEVYDNSGVLVAGIYPNDGNNGLKIISKYILKMNFDDGSHDDPAIPVVLIDFREEMPK